MNEITLEKGKILLETIYATKEGLAALNKFKLDNNKTDHVPDNIYDDGVYSLYIGEHSDLSGNSAELVRYGGNLELLDVMIEELKRQLKMYEAEFNSL